MILSRHRQIQPYRALQDKLTGYWLEPIELSWNHDFNSRELKQIERHLQDNLAYLIESWDEFFGVSGADETE